MRTNRKPLVIGLVVAALGAVIALVTSSAVKTFPVNSPQYAVQQFLSATASGDYEKAATYFAAKSLCTVADLENSYPPENFQVELIDVSSTGDTSLVKVAVGIGVEGPFDSLYQENHAYRLVKTDRWLIEGTPWPLYQCGVVKQP